MSAIDHLLSFIAREVQWDDTIELKRNELLKQENTIDTNIYYVVEGSLRIYVMEEIEDHTIRFGYKGSLIAALDSYITQRSSPLLIQALKRTTLKKVSKEKLEKIIISSTEYTHVWIKVWQDFALQQMEREIDILTTSPRERYLRVLKRSPHLFQIIPHKYIAAYLRMTPETLSRLKKS